MFTSIVLSLVLTLIGTHSFNEVPLSSQPQSQGVDTVIQTTVATASNLDLSPGSPLIKKAITGFSYGLNHKIEGVVESAIYQIMILSLRAPKVDLTPLKVQLKEMSTSHNLASIRVRSFLALEFLTNESYRKQVEDFVQLNKDQQEPVVIFKNISDRLTEQALERSR